MPQPIKVTLTYRENIAYWQASTLDATRERLYIEATQNIILHWATLKLADNVDVPIDGYTLAQSLCKLLWAIYYPVTKNDYFFLGGQDKDGYTFLALSKQALGKLV